MAATQVVNITVQALNGNALPNTPHILFPTQGILVTQLTTPIVFNDNDCVSQITLLSSGAIYLSATTVADIATAANA